MSQKQKVSISDAISEVLFHVLFFPFIYFFFRLKKNNHSQALEKYKETFLSLSEFVVFIILFVAISFIVVLVDTLKV